MSRTAVKGVLETDDGDSQSIFYKDFEDRDEALEVASALLCGYQDTETETLKVELWGRY